MKSVCRGLVLLAVVSGSARADGDAQAQAKAHADEGTRWFNVQEYAKAAAEYEQAYLIDARPAYLYAKAQAERLGGDCEKAIRSYNSYLRTNPTDPSLAQANIDRCEQYIKDH